MLAAEHGHTETVQALIAASADVNVTCQQVSCAHVNTLIMLFCFKNAYFLMFDLDSTSL